MGVLQYCTPRKDLLEDSINLGIFTASLDEVHRHYADGSLHNSVYTDAEVFFQQATYVTPSMKRVFSDVFARLSGDTTATLLNRLETGFGGGKTHTLIACMHMAKRGRAISSAAGDALPEALLPEPGEVSVAAIAGEMTPVTMTKGAQVLPFPLWAEIARQIGGNALSEKVRGYMHRLDSPDEAYFQEVFGERKVLILIDELAHYAARWSVAHPAAGDMLAAFFMSLFGYARQNPRIAVVVTLASLRDAFSAQTGELEKKLTEISGEKISRNRAEVILERAVDDISTVIARDETVVVPVEAKDLSLVLGKRLFQSIDSGEAVREAAQYRTFYDRNLSLLQIPGPLDEYIGRMKVSYPFHPTLIDFLNNKLSTVPTFQKTRGVLRILALAVRALWKSGRDVPMIHASDLDFEDSRTVSELVGRTHNDNLMAAINADIGTADSRQLSAGMSNADLADLDNPHPENIPYNKATWKTVFLHSLAGKDEGLGGAVFGLSEPDALLAVSRPGLSPAQVQEALKAIAGRAYYLHYKSDKYYADSNPTINVPLSDIRRNLSEEQILQEIEVKARKIVSAAAGGFQIKTDIAQPADIPEVKDRPVLGILSPRVRSVDPAQFITTMGKNNPRIYQNNIFLLVHDMAEIESGGKYLFSPGDEKREKIRQEIFDLARIVIAMKRLKDNPQNYGLNHKHLQEQGFEADLREREKALETRINQAWSRLIFPSAEDKKFMAENIRTAGGEGGEPVLQLIDAALKKNGKIITSGEIHAESLNALHQLIFQSGEYVPADNVKSSFSANRAWPTLEEPKLFRQIIQEGVRGNKWRLAGKINEATGRPETFYDDENPDIPLDVNVEKDHALVTVGGARKRNWGSSAELEPEEVKNVVSEVFSQNHAMRVARAVENAAAARDDVKEPTVREAVRELVATEKLLVYRGDPDQKEKPEDLQTGPLAAQMETSADAVAITRGEAARRGWLETAPDSLTLSGDEGQRIILGLLKRLGSLYTRNARATLRSLHLMDYEAPGGGRISVTIEDGSPETMKHLAELFSLLGDKITPTSDSQVLLQIDDPDPACPLVQEINKQRGHEK